MFKKTIWALQRVSPQRMYMICTMLHFTTGCNNDQFQCNSKHSLLLFLSHTTNGKLTCKMILQ